MLIQWADLEPRDKARLAECAERLRSLGEPKQPAPLQLVRRVMDDWLKRTRPEAPDAGAPPDPRQHALPL